MTEREDNLFDFFGSNNYYSEDEDVAMSTAKEQFGDLSEEQIRAVWEDFLFCNPD
jgi:hypothetical protein